MTTEQKILTVAGRMVQGNIFEPQTTDMKGNPLRDQKGNPKVQYFFALAVEKNSPEWAGVWQELSAIAQRDFPGGQSQKPDFSWKIVDGDKPENAGKEGFPGHWVFRFTSGFPIQAAADNGTRPILNKDEIKRGYYLRVWFKSQGNGDNMKPGIYLNPVGVLLIGYGQEITSGPDMAALAGSVQGGYVPPGMQSSPVSQPSQVPGGAPGYGQQGPAQGGAPGYGQQGPAPGGALIPPNYDILNPQ